MPLETLFKKISDEENRLKLFLEESLRSVSISEKDTAYFYIGILKILESQNKLIGELRAEIEERMLIQSEENELIRKLIGANESKAKTRAVKYAGEIVALKEKLYEQEKLRKKCDELETEKNNLELMIAEVRDKHKHKIETHFREIEEEKRILQQAFLDMGLRQERLSKEVKQQKEVVSTGMDTIRRQYFGEFASTYHNTKAKEARMLENIITDFIFKARNDLKNIIIAIENNLGLLDLKKLGFINMSDSNSIARLKEYFKNIKQAFLFVARVLKTQQDVSLNFTKILEIMKKLDNSARKYLEIVSPVQSNTVCVTPSGLKDRMENIFFTACPNRDILLEFEIPGNLPDIIVDVNSLGIAFSEIFKNAAESIEGAGELKVSLELDNFKNMFTLRVCNNGKPVSEAIRHFIFNPFVTDKPFREGLGLAKAKIACQRFGGDVVLAKSNEEETVFEIQIPAMLKA